MHKKNKLESTLMLNVAKFAQKGMGHGGGLIQGSFVHPPVLWERRVPAEKPRERRKDGEEGRA